MTQHVVTIRLPVRDEAYRLSAVLTDLAEPAPEALSVFEDGEQWRIDAYFADLPGHEAISHVQHAARIAELGPVSADISEVPDKNWVAVSQAALPPVQTARFTVHGSHDRASVGRRQWAIEIDAGEAFGTAHHATTYGCLDAIGRLMPIRSIGSILDLGTGSGILAIAAARAWPSARIVASDFDADAVLVATSNSIKNEAGHKVYVTRCTGIPSSRCLPGGARQTNYDLIIANILAGPLCDMASGMARAAKPGGLLVLSGILNRQAAVVRANYVAHGFAVRYHARIEGWSTLILRRRA